MTTVFDSPTRVIRRAMGQIGFALGRRVSGDAGLYWPVPPQGLSYRVNRDRTELVITAVKDARRW